MNSRSLLSAYFAVMCSLSSLVCSAGNGTRIATFQTASAGRIVDGAQAGTVDCRYRNKYRFVVVGNPTRKKDSDVVIPEDLNIVLGDKVLSKIELPNEAQVKNFSLNSIKKNKTGFELNVDWGGGLHHYAIRFNFKCKGTGFYLYEVTKESFSTSNPESGKFLDKKESNVRKIEPNLPIAKFSITDYL